MTQIAISYPENQPFTEEPNPSVETLCNFIHYHPLNLPWLEEQKNTITRWIATRSQQIVDHERLREERRAAKRAEREARNNGGNSGNDRQRRDRQQRNNNEFRATLEQIQNNDRQFDNDDEADEA